MLRPPRLRNSAIPAIPRCSFCTASGLGREIWSSARPRAGVSAITSSRIDLPGHGALAGVPSFTERRLDGKLLNERHVDKVVGSAPLMIGYSLGGFVAMRYASRFPERTRALLLADCTLDFEAWKRWP